MWPDIGLTSGVTINLIFLQNTPRLHNTQYNGYTGQDFQAEKAIEIQLVRPTEVCGKVRKMAKVLLKHNCFCPMLLMRTTKTAVCLQTKAFFHHLCGF